MSWQGKDAKTGDTFTSGLAAAFRLRHAKQPELQRAGATFVSAVLLSDALKTADRVSAEHMEGICGYACASCENAALLAAKT